MRSAKGWSRGSQTAPAKGVDAGQGLKIEDQASADAVPRNVTIGFYGPLSLKEGSDARWIEAAEQAYRDDAAAERQQRAIQLEGPDDYAEEFGDEEVPF